MDDSKNPYLWPDKPTQPSSGLGISAPITPTRLAVENVPRRSIRGSKLSLVIPVFNEEKGLDALVAALAPALDTTGMTWEIVFIDDGSRDRSLDLLYVLNKRDPRLKAIALSRNFGKEIAVAAGLRYTSGDAVVIMDADLQHPPATVLTFIEKWREGYDVVYGQRDDREADGAARRLFSVAFYGLFERLSRTRLPDGAGDFRLMDRKAVDAFNRFGERARFNKGLYAWIGFRSLGVSFNVPPRFDGGGSRWRPRQLARFALDGLISFSTVPLRIWSYVGVAISSLAFLYVLVFLAKTLVFGSDPGAPGFPTLVVAVMFLGGVQLISLGVIGEYLGRMFEEVKNRPLFLVAEEIGVDQDLAKSALERRRG